MIKPEDFQQLVKDVEAGVEPSVPVADLVETIKEMDMQLLIAQNGLELSMVNLATVVPDLSERILAMCGRTDTKSKKKVAELAAQIVSQCEDSVQTYLVKATLEAVRVLGMEIPEPVAEETVEGIDWTPHNHD